MVDPPAAAHVLLMTRAGCHLCDEAQQVVREQAAAADASWSDHDVDADPELRAEFGDRVPVVLVAPQRPAGPTVEELLAGAVEVGHFHISRPALARAIERLRGQ